MRTILQSDFSNKPIKPYDIDDWIRVLKEPFYISFFESELKLIKNVLAKVNYRNIFIDNIYIDKKEVNTIINKLRKAGVKNRRKSKAITNGKELDPTIHFMVFLKRLTKNKSGFTVYEEENLSMKKKIDDLNIISWDGEYKITVIDFNRNVIKEVILKDPVTPRIAYEKILEIEKEYKEGEE